MDFNQMAYIQMIKNVHDRINESDDATTQNANTLIQLFNAPYDKVTLGSTVLTSLNVDPSSNMVWGVTSGFTWDNGGVYDPFFTATHAYTDTLTLAATATVTTAFIADLAWGSAAVNPHWSWNIGAVYQ